MDKSVVVFILPPVKPFSEGRLTGNNRSGLTNRVKKVTSDILKKYN